MYTEIALFAAFVTIGVLNRKRPRIHRPMMLMASLAIVSGATARIAQVGSIFGGHLWMATVRAGGDAGSAAAGGARGDDAELRSAVCDGAGRAGGGDVDRGKAGDDEHVGGLGGDDFEAVRDVAARARKVRAPQGVVKHPSGAKAQCLWGARYGTAEAVP